MEKKLVLNERSYNPSQVCKSIWLMVESQISLRSWSDQKFLLSALQKFVKSIFFKCFSCPHCKSLQKFLSSELQRPTSSSSPACPRHAQDTRCLVRLTLTTIIITFTTINIITTTTITIMIIITTTSGSTWWEISPTISLPMFSSRRCANNSLKFGFKWINPISMDAR